MEGVVSGEGEVGRWWWCWGVGGGAHSNKSCLVLIKGPQRSPAVTNRARTEAEDPRRGEFMLSLVGFYLQKKPLQVLPRAKNIFLSLSAPHTQTHSNTHKHTHTCMHAVAAAAAAACQHKGLEYFA